MLSRAAESINVPDLAIEWLLHIRLGDVFSKVEV